MAYVHRSGGQGDDDGEDSQRHRAGVQNGSRRFHGQNRSETIVSSAFYCAIMSSSWDCNYASSTNFFSAIGTRIRRLFAVSFENDMADYSIDNVPKQELLTAVRNSWVRLFFMLFEGICRLFSTFDINK